MTETNASTPHVIDPLGAMNRIFDRGVGVILESNDFPTLLAHLQQALRPLAAAFAAEAEDATPGDVERAARGLATHIAFELWNTTPIPDNHFRPRKLARPERNTPCPCGSGHKYKQCCGAVDTPPLVLPPDEMLARVLGHLPREGLADVGAPPQVLGLVAERWFDERRFDDVVALLEPIFADPAKLDERAEHAANILLNSYLTLQRCEQRDALLARLEKAPDRILRSTALQRAATIRSDCGDSAGAWQAFKEAQRLTPDDPTLSHLEVLLLLADGRRDEARARVEFWSAKLARDPDYDHHPLIEALHALVEGDAIGDLLDELPRDYPERRLLLHIALEDIEPPIWRRLEVENTLSFAALHHLIQTAMGWEDAHLHEFEVGDYRIGNIAEYDNPYGETVLPGEEVELGQVIGRRRSFTYVYDFGDDWRHRITIEKRLPSDPLRRPAALIDGARACPPEDCGGVYGYSRILEAKRAPRSAESRELLQWLGPYQPEAFKLASHQKRIDALFRRLR